ncbi:uncharacterized protein [Hyperolius riggenbachi]|uniref:uncharacterized protein isoform X2 n=1 Tax=Hyperolius riggenbachi TaxID=752182 RepID=UPI0035A273A6
MERWTSPKPVVSFSLQITGLPSYIEVKENEELVLRCPFNNGSDRVAVSADFYRLPDEMNPVKSTIDKRIMVNSTDTTLTMRISRAQQCDSGVYICVAKQFRADPLKSNGTTLEVLPNPVSAVTQMVPSYTLQTAVDLTRIGLLLVLIVLLIILIWKFW